MKIFQKGFNFSQDGPGNRLVYHVAGCNMHCLWCSNPEGMAVQEKYKSYTAAEIAAEADSCRMMFFDSGGVTFTGGEATLDADVLIEALAALKEKNIHTAIETNGTSERLLEISKYVDYLIMDFKHYDDEILKKYTGIDGKTIKNNYRLICDSGRQCHIRIPLINEFNAHCAKDFSKFFSSCNTQNVIFEFLKYHEFGKAKWNGKYKITDGFVDTTIINSFKNIFTEHGLKYTET